MASSSSTASQQQHQQQHHRHQSQPQSFVSSRVGQFTTLAVVQPRPPAAGGRWLAGRKSDDHSLDRLVAINAARWRLADSGGGGGGAGRGAVRVRPSTSQHAAAASLVAAASSPAVYGRAKLLPVTNNVAKPYAAARANH